MPRGPVVIPSWQGLLCLWSLVRFLTLGVFSMCYPVSVCACVAECQEVGICVLVWVGVCV